MSDLIIFFALIGFLAAFVFFICAIIWVMVMIDSRRMGRQPKKPEKYEVEHPKASVLGTQIRRPGNEPDHSGSFLDW
jgi:predicted membrane protein